MEAPAIRRGRMTLLDQISIMDTANLRNLLKIRQEDTAGGGDRTGNATLAPMLASEKRGGRTLLDVFRNEGDSSREGGVIGGGAKPEREEARLMRVSLMTLLSLADPAQTEESAAGSSGSGEAVTEASEVEPPAAKDERLVCCVCIVRRKGAAFIPCGHTFCRVCSRDLWTSRGSCPSLR